MDNIEQNINGNNNLQIGVNNGDIINAETGEFITESGDNKDIDKVAESLFPDNN